MTRDSGLPPFIPSSSSTGEPAVGGSHGAQSAPRHRPERRFDTPRRVRNGVKLQSKLPFIPSSALAQGWMRLLEGRIAGTQLSEGAEYARAGQTISISTQANLAPRPDQTVSSRRSPPPPPAAVLVESKPGVIEGLVQGTAPRAYRTRIRLPILAPEDWDRVIAAMSHEALYVAKLLAGEMPSTIEEVFVAAGAHLLPSDPEALKCECDCRAEHPCKHAATLGWLVAEQFELEPLSVFALLGMPAERLIDRLRHARVLVDLAGRSHEPSATGDGSGHGGSGASGGGGGGGTNVNGRQGNGGAAATHRDSPATHPAPAQGDPMIPESQVEPPPLEQCLDEFWRIGARLSELETKPPPQHVPHALLRRLGPSPMNGKFPLVGLLASIYDTVANQARRIRDKDEDAGKAS